jgi:hypothetical protein
MTHCTINPATTITVRNHAMLRKVWSIYSPAARQLIGSMVVETPLTETQTRRLPERLRRVLSVQ